ncbi:MAG: glycosyltransferase [Bacillota bacterium]
MKIALLVPTLEAGGMERVAIRMADLLSGQHEVFIVLFSIESTGYECTHRIVDLGVRSSGGHSVWAFVRRVMNTLRRIHRLGRALRANEADVCFSFGSAANIVNLLATGRHRRIVSLRGYGSIIQPSCLVDRVFRIPVARAIYSMAHAIVCVSRRMQLDFIQNYRIRAEKVHVLNNGFDIAQIRDLSRQPCPPAFDETSVQKDVVIAVGNLRPPKGYWHLIRSFSWVVGQNERAHLVILGADQSGHKEKLERLVDLLHIGDSVTLMGFDENPFKYIRRSRVYVLSSIMEGFPNALVEAMICGAPVIASDCRTGPREILTGDCIDRNQLGIEYAPYGILVPAQEPEEIFDDRPLLHSEMMMALAIDELLRNDDKRKHYSMQAMKRGEAFGYSGWRSALSSLLQDDAD